MLSREDKDLNPYLADSGLPWPANIEDMGSVPGLVRFPGEGNGNPVQYFCLRDPMDKGSRWATVHRVSKSWTRFNDSACIHTT